MLIGVVLQWQIHISVIRGPDDSRFEVSLHVLEVKFLKINYQMTGGGAREFKLIERTRVSVGNWFHLSWVATPTLWWRYRGPSGCKNLEVEVALETFIFAENPEKR